MKRSDNTSKIGLRWDTLESTYYWIIRLDLSDPTNSPGADPMYGYSKAIGHDEPWDKEQLLKKEIKMLVNHGYLKRAVRIEIYWKQGSIIDKNRDPKLLTLYRNDFRLEDRCLKPKYFGLQEFLRKLYALIEKGGDVSQLQTKQPAGPSKDEDLNPSRFNFKSHKELDAYCSKLVRDGRAFGHVTAFRSEYLRRKPLSSNE